MAAMQRWRKKISMKSTAGTKIKVISYVINGDIACILN